MDNTSVIVPAALFEVLAEIAQAAHAYDESQTDRVWRLANFHGQALHETLMDLPDGWQATLEAIDSKTWRAKGFVWTDDSPLGALTVHDLTRLVSSWRPEIPVVVALGSVGDEDGPVLPVRGVTWLGAGEDIESQVVLLTVEEEET